jgi:hypothetical protein
LVATQHENNTVATQHGNNMVATQHDNNMVATQHDNNMAAAQNRVQTLLGRNNSTKGKKVETTIHHAK